MEYKLIRSGRKTLALQIKNGAVIIRAPFKTSKEDIDSFIEKHRGWIEKNLSKMKEREEALGGIRHLSEEDIRALADKAREIVPNRVRFYAEKIGVTYAKITIRKQSTRWGSCSAKGNLNFNCLLMLAPPEVLDSVVVHELCHRKEMNHSKRFYVEVLRAYPEYRKWDRWLKDNGEILMRGGNNAV